MSASGTSPSETILTVISSLVRASASLGDQASSGITPSAVQPVSAVAARV